MISSGWLWVTCSGRSAVPRLFVAIVLLLLTSTSNAKAQFQSVVLPDTGKEITLYDESHALIIGISDYNNGWPKLRGVPEDIKAVDAALQMVGFQTEVVMDPDRAGLDK